jgi:hypothetical protein
MSSLMLHNKIFKNRPHFLNGESGTGQKPSWQKAPQYWNNHTILIFCCEASDLTWAFSRFPRKKQLVKVRPSLKNEKKRKDICFVFCYFRPKFGKVVSLNSSDFVDEIEQDKSPPDKKPPNIEIIIQSYYICFILRVILKDILKN